MSIGGACLNNCARCIIRYTQCLCQYFCDGETECGGVRHASIHRSQLPFALSRRGEAGCGSADRGRPTGAAGHGARRRHADLFCTSSYQFTR